MHSPLKSTTASPTVEQFASFVQVFSHVNRAECQCIWYLPSRKRCCMVGISPEANWEALTLVKDVLSGSSLDKTPTLLAKIAELACCGRHHRNKVWGSGLAEELAARWWVELQTVVSHWSGTKSVSAKQFPISTTLIDDAPRASSSIGLGAQNKQPKSHPPPLVQKSPLLRSRLHATPISFVRHEVLEGESLLSKILSAVEQHESKDGSVYIYTHTDEVFEGMIKIGYTSSNITSRLSSWSQCGQGDPILLECFSGVRNPKRVELLTHFELIDVWYAQRWCNNHSRAHIEWFKVSVARASTIIALWSQWMARANPYDRRGHLKATWITHIDFLTKFEVPITAIVLMQVQEIEEGSPIVQDFIDDDRLRSIKESEVKLELPDDQ